MQRRREPNVAFKTILVHADDEPRTMTRVELAAKIAPRSGGVLSVIYTLGTSIEPDGSSVVQAGVADADYDKKVDDIELAKRVAAAAGVACEWAAIRGEPAAALIASGRCADLIVLGQRDPQDREDAGGTDLPAEVVLGAGRPVLIVPRDQSIRSFAERVVIAWNGTRESARAVADALPLLLHAKSIRILSGAEYAMRRIATSGAALVKSLERHGMKADLSDLGRHRFDVGEKILSFCAEHQADLLVMGAYGHLRARELVLGGVTQTVMESMTVPVLMSH